MKLRTRSTDRQLRNIFRDVMAHEGPADDWLVGRPVRGAPLIERPPFRIDVTSTFKARPSIYDPMTFLRQLRELAA